MSYYTTACICLEGHVISHDITFRQEKYCSVCGSEAIKECPSCKSDIQGIYVIPDVIDLYPNYIKPSYCHNCGKPFPWTVRAIEAAEEAIKMNMAISDREQRDLIQELPNLVSNVSRTAIAAEKIKAYLSRFPSEVLTKIIVTLCCDAAKSIIFPNK